MLLSAFFSHCLASLFGLALSFQAFLQEKLALSAFLQDSGLLCCRFESADQVFGCFAFSKYDFNQSIITFLCTINLAN